MRERPGIVCIGGIAALWLTAAGTAVAAPAARIEIGAAAGPPGAQVTLAVRLRADDAPVSGLAHDLRLPPGVSVAPRPGAPDKPDCRIGSDLLAAETGAGFYWDGWGRPAARIITARERLPERTLLYTCTLDIAPDAAEGRHAIGCTYAEATEITGREVAATCTAGALRIDAELPPVTATPPPAAGTPTPTATACADCGPLLIVGEVHTLPGERIELPLVLRTGLALIAGVQADIGFPPQVRVPARPDGEPDCVPDETVLGWTGAAYLHARGGPDGETAIRVLVLPAELKAIADNTTVLRCQVDVRADAAPATYVLAVSNNEGGDPDGNALAVPARDGIIHVLNPPAEGQRPVVDPSGSAGASGGCAVAPAGGSAWHLLLPALLWSLRRRRGS